MREREGKRAVRRKEEEPTFWVREGRERVEESLMKAVVMGRGTTSMYTQ